MYQYFRLINQLHKDSWTLEKDSLLLEDLLLTREMLLSFHNSLLVTRLHLMPKSLKDFIGELLDLLLELQLLLLLFFLIGTMLNISKLFKEVKDIKNKRLLLKNGQHNLLKISKFNFWLMLFNQNLEVFLKFIVMLYPMLKEMLLRNNLDPKLFLWLLKLMDLSTWDTELLLLIMLMRLKSSVLLNGLIVKLTKLITIPLNSRLLLVNLPQRLRMLKTMLLISPDI